MTPLRLPSLDVPEGQKRAFSEADVHSTLFEPDMQALGYPPRLRNEIDEAIFDLFEIRSSREEIRHFYATVSRVEAEPQAASE